MRKIYAANTIDKHWQRKRFVLWFGACAPTFILAYGSLSDALEEAADEIARRGWFGLFTDPEYPAGMEHLEDDENARVADECEAALIYTESGWIHSCEWGIALDNPSNEELVSWVKND